MNAEHTRNPSFVAARTGPVLDLGDHRIHIIFSPASIGSDFALVELEVDPGGGPPRHVHAREDEIFVVEAGRFAFQIGDETIEAGPGDSLFARGNIPHAWCCISEEPGRMVAVVTPGANFEAFVRAMDKQQISLTSPKDAGRLLALAEKHGIKFQQPWKS